MNVERLHAILRTIQADISASKYANQLGALISNLQNQVNQPNQGQHQSGVASARTKLIQTLRGSRVNEFPPMWGQTIEEIGGTSLLGDQLADRIDDIFSRNQITPAAALQELQVIQSEFSEFETAVNSTLDGFKRLGIHADELNPGEAELATLVPREYVSNNLDKFAAELKTLNAIFGAFSELATGVRPGFPIREISSSDLSIFLQIDPLTVAAIVTGLERILHAYKTVLEIRSLRASIKKAQMGEDFEEKLIERATDKMREEIDRAADELLEQHRSHQIEETRLNELRTDIRLALKRLAHRIDNGFNFEPRVEPEQRENDDQSAGAEDSEKTAAQMASELISRARDDLNYINLEGEPILRLKFDDGSGSEEDSEGSENGGPRPRSRRKKGED